MHRREADDGAEIGVERGDVAVADEGRARVPHAFCVEQRQQLDAAIPAAHGNHRVRVERVEGPQQRHDANARTPGRERLPLEDVLVPHRIEAEPPDFLNAAVELSSVEGTRGSHERNAAALSHRPELDQTGRGARGHCQAAISSATARCSSQPMRSSDGNAGRCTNRSFTAFCLCQASSMRF